MNRLVKDLKDFWRSRFRIFGLLGLIAAILIPGLILVVATLTSCDGPNGKTCPALGVGPNGAAVNDEKYLLHQTLAGDGSITARVTALTGKITYPPPHHDKIVTGVVPWAKAGVIIKENLRQGSPYAAMLTTGEHGSRFQYNYVNDIAAGSEHVSAESPIWIRLTRTGDMISGYESTDGASWKKVATVNVMSSASPVEIGLFATSPCDLTANQGFLSGPDCRFAEATATFDNVKLEGTASGAVWTSEDIGAEKNLPSHLYGHAEQTADKFIVTGSGDISPMGADGGAKALETTLAATWLGVIVAVILALHYLGSRKTATLSRQEILSKMLTAGINILIVATVAAAITLSLGWLIMRESGANILPATGMSVIRIVFGAGAIVALSSMFALGLGVLMKRKIAAILAVSLIVVPYLLAITSALPPSVSSWMLRLTPAAGFSVMQTLAQYSQVTASYTPNLGYFPLSPIFGFGVLNIYVIVVIALAMMRGGRMHGSG
jgi:hypothetical protein